MTGLCLYGTAGCHLCEEAERLLRELGRTAGPLAVKTVDIASDAELEARYGVRIPVLLDSATGAELGWPFDAAALARFIGAATREDGPP